MKMLMKGNSLGKKREGFTLIELLIVMVILAILAGIVIISIGGVIGRGQATAYNADREQIEAAVAEFMTRPTDATYHHEIGETPKTTGANRTADTIIGEDVIPGEIYYEVALCPLLTSSYPQGILKQIPATAATANLANTGANAEARVDDSGTCVGAVTTGHYVWYSTGSGDVLSVCVGPDCTNGVGGKNESVMDGFQDVYP